MATDRTKYLYHVTLAENWYSIGVQGLLADLSNSKREKIGLVTRSKLQWALGHTCQRHNASASDCIVIAVRVRRSEIKRNRLRGVWYAMRDIPLQRIESIKHAADYFSWVHRPGDCADPQWCVIAYGLKGERGQWEYDYSVQNSPLDTTFFESEDEHVFPESWHCEEHQAWERVAECYVIDEGE